MSLFADFFFGKKRKIMISNIGNFVSRIKNENPSTNYSWQFYGIVLSQNKDTSIILDGDSKAPYKRQLEALYEFLNSELNVIKQVESKLLNSPNYSNIKNEFFIASINSLDVNENSFEVTFESLDEDNQSYIGFIWNNNSICEFEAK